MDKRKIFSKFLKSSNTLGVLRKYSKNRALRILMYHRILNKDSHLNYYLGGISHENFDKQMECLTQYFSVVSLDEVVGSIKNGRALPNNAVAVTIDDGYKDCYESAYPILRKYNIPATVYLTTGQVGSRELFWVDKIDYFFKMGKPKTQFYEHRLFGCIEMMLTEKRLTHLESVVQKLKTVSESEKNSIIDELQDFFQVTDDKLQVNYNLSWAQVREMSKNGISFGAHTVTHPILTRIPIDEAEKEIVESKKRIEGEIGKPVYGFCYPNGTETDFNDSIIEILKKHGFTYAVTTIWGTNDIYLDLFRLKRMEPNFDGDMAYFECLLSGAFELKDRVKGLASPSWARHSLGHFALGHNDEGDEIASALRASQ